MLHQIQHSEIIDGLKYEIIHEDHQEKAVDFLFEVFLKAEHCGRMSQYLNHLEVILLKIRLLLIK